ncbi:unnamed protein product, partial [Phaeothamnion confervicola]
MRMPASRSFRLPLPSLQRNSPCAADTNGAAGLALVEFLLACAGHPLKKLAILTMDFWLELQDVPVSERHPALGRPLYARLLTVLLRQCQYPPGFDGWSNGGGGRDDDGGGPDAEDAFRDLREGAQGVKDVLLVAYYLLRAEYLTTALNAAQASPGQWQALEVAMFAVTAVSKQIRDWLRGAVASGGGKETAADARHSSMVIGSLLAELLRNQALSGHPLVLKAGCQMVGGFAALLSGKTAATTAGAAAPAAAAAAAAAAVASAGADMNDLLVPALQYLLGGLQVAEARNAAALAIRSVCAACDRDIVARPAAISLLLMMPTAAGAAPGVQLEERLFVTEAGVRTLALLDPDQAAPLLLRFCGQALHALGVALGATPPNAAEASAALQVLAQAVRFLDVPGAAGGDGSRHASAELLRNLWPLLEACASRLCNNEETMTQLFALISKMLMSLRDVLGTQVHVPTLLNMATNCFDARRFPCCLDCMATAVEVYG